VDRIITNLGVLDVVPGGLRIVECAPGVSEEDFAAPPRPGSPRRLPLPEVEREDRGSKRRYVIRAPEGEAELTLSVLSPDR
jgi:hypothetical protein